MEINEFIETFYAIGDGLSQNKFAVILFRYNIAQYYPHHIDNDILQSVIVGGKIEQVLYLIRELKNCNREVAISEYNWYRSIYADMLLELRSLVKYPVISVYDQSFDSIGTKAFIARVDEMNSDQLLTTVVVDRIL